MSKQEDEKQPVESVGNECLDYSLTRAEVAAIVKDDLRREALEGGRLQYCEHGHDFNSVIKSIIEDLEELAEKYKSLLQMLYPEPEEQPSS